MTTEAEPIEGTWYESPHKSRPFQVVAVDEAAAIVAIQYHDGELEPLDLEAWYELDLEPIEPPEDWTGPLDDVELDDLELTDSQMSDEDWLEPVGEHARPHYNGAEPPDEDELDDWGEGLPEGEPLDEDRY